MIKKYIIEGDDSLKGFDEAIEKLEREWGAEEVEQSEDCISRQQALEVVCQSYKETAENYKVKRIKAIEDGDRLKAAEYGSNAEYFNQIAEWLDELSVRRSQYDCFICGMFDKVAERIQRRMKDSNDFLVYDNKRYVSFSELCEILEGKDILKDGDE